MAGVALVPVCRPDDVSLRRPPDISMVEATDFGNLPDRAEFRWLDWPSVRCVLLKREMRSSAVIVGEVAGQDAAQMVFAQDKDMIEALSPDRTDQPLRERILPRAVRRRDDFIDAQALDSMPEPLGVNPVTIAKEVARRGLVREGVHDCWAVQ